MENRAEKCVERDGLSEEVGCESESFSEFGEERRESNSSSTGVSSSSTDEGSSKEAWVLLGWPMRTLSLSCSALNNSKIHQSDGIADKPKQVFLELEMMKERFAKLLLGEDMSGSGKGVCSAMAISNAITNLCATLFGQLRRLEPLSDEKKSMWRREMDCLVCVSDHIVEFKPSWQTFNDGSKLEVMSCRPRPDLCINLPALRKLDNLLIDILDSFKDVDFWYVDKGILASEANGSAKHQEKWWLPSPSVPPGGLSEKARTDLGHKRDCTSQILKAAMAINSNTLAEMEVPDSYIESLPKNGRACLGEKINRFITTENFNPECVLDCLDLNSEHRALEFANRFEAASCLWHQRTAAARAAPCTNNGRPSWGMVKEIMMVDGDNKRELLASRADALLLCLKQRFPGLTQTALDTSKIQFNKDVGKSILEAYSRVLESLAYSIIARIEDLFYADDLAKGSNESDVFQTRAHIPFPVSVSGTPYKAQLLSNPAMGTERSPFINRKLRGRGFGVKKVLNEYLGGAESKEKAAIVVSGRRKV